MLYTPLWKRLVILVVCAWGLLGAMPNLFYTRVEQHNDAAKAAAIVTDAGGAPTEEEAAAAAGSVAAPGPNLLSADTLLGLPLAEAERRLIEATLALHNGSVPKAARVLDVSPSTLYRKIEAWSAKAS